VRVDAILCDHVQAAENKLYISGGGVTRAWVPPEPPHVIKLGVGAIVRVPYTATNQAHSVTISMSDEDGEEVFPYVPDGVPDPGPVRLTVPFNLGRPPGITPGESQAYPVAANFQFGLRRLGGYKFVISVDGTAVTELPFRVATAPVGSGVPGL
jgi:hypothetical protein